MSEILDRITFQQHSYALPDPLENVDLRRCTFESCQNSLQRTLANRPTVRNVSLTRCHVRVSDLGPIVAEDCTIDTIWFHRGMWGPQHVAGCAFKHVVVRGNVIGSVKFLPSMPWLLNFHARPPASEDPFAVANAAYYRYIDWALDISQASFTSIEMKYAGIPARLIRRDPETQVVMTRQLAKSGAWIEPLSDSYWRFGIDQFMKSGFDDFVLVACKRSKDFQEQVEWIRRLRAGAAVVAD